VPEQQSRQKTVIEFNSGRTSFDVVHLSYQAQKKQFAKGKWLEDLRPYFAKAPAEFDFKDFSTGGVSYATQNDGRIDSLPLNLDPWILYYNKELFAAKNIAPPKTFAELVTAAQKLHDPSKGVVGMVGRGVKNANVLLWTSFFLGYGGTFIDTLGKLQTDSPAAFRPPRCIAICSRIPVRLASPALTGMKRKVCSCKAAPPCGSTAAVSRRHWKI